MGAQINTNKVAAWCGSPRENGMFCNFNTVNLYVVTVSQRSYQGPPSKSRSQPNNHNISFLFGFGQIRTPAKKLVPKSHVTANVAQLDPIIQISECVFLLFPPHLDSPVVYLQRIIRLSHLILYLRVIRQFLMLKDKMQSASAYSRRSGISLTMSLFSLMSGFPIILRE